MAECDQIFSRRQQIVDGVVEPEEEETTGSLAIGDVNNNLPDASVAVEPIGIPNFWPTALRVWLKVTSARREPHADARSRTRPQYAPQAHGRQSETLTLVRCSLLCPGMAAFAKRVNESLPAATVGAGATAGAAAAAALSFW